MDGPPARALLQRHKLLLRGRHAAGVVQAVRQRLGRLAGLGGLARLALLAALRSALLRDREAHLFAGVGVVAGSDPEAELAETEVKLQALLPLLTE